MASPSHRRLGSQSQQRSLVNNDALEPGPVYDKTYGAQETTLPPPTTSHEYKRTRWSTGPSMKLVRIKSSGESGRGGIHPWHFFRICFRSSCKASAAVNILWPIVPVALAIRCKSCQPGGGRSFAESGPHDALGNLSLFCVLCPSLISNLCRFRYFAGTTCSHFHSFLHRHGSLCQPDRIRRPRVRSQSSSCGRCAH